MSDALAGVAGEPVHGDRVAAGEVDRLRRAVEEAVAERTAAFLELMDRRTEAAVLVARVAVLEAQAADHPSRLQRLAAECEEWASRAGAAEADLDAVVAQRDLLAAELEAARGELAAARARIGQRVGRAGADAATGRSSAVR